jgi:probable F420-dependent oxidoreductase
MHLGFASFNIDQLATPGFGRLARLAEDLGYESLWTAEHIVLADLPPGEAVRPGTLPFLDSIAILGFLAAETKRIKLATGVLLLPQHQPLLLAKQLASLDVLSQGRLIVGIGVGGVEEEARAMGVSMHERGSRGNEYIEAMLAMWTMPHPSYSGRHIQFDGINAYPRPVQQPHPPIVIGGRSAGAYRRTLKYAAGWYGFNLTLEQTQTEIAAIAALREHAKRPAELGDVEITIAPRERLTRELIDAYAQAGVSRLLLRLPASKGLDAAEQVMRDNAPAQFGLASG